MKLFRYTCGIDDVYGAALDEQDAYDRRAEVDETFHFLTVTIEEVKVKGFDIVMQPSGVPPDLTVDEIKAWLDERGIKYHPQTGEKKLRELYKESVNT